MLCAGVERRLEIGHSRAKATPGHDSPMTRGKHLAEHCSSHLQAACWLEMGPAGTADGPTASQSWAKFAAVAIFWMHSGTLQGERDFFAFAWHSAVYE